MLESSWKTVILLVAAVPLPLAAQSVADHVSLGIAADQAHDPGTALLHFEAALDADSSGYDANWRAALTLLNLVDLLPDSLRPIRRDSLYALAEHYAGRAVASNPRGADGHFAYAAAVGTGALIQGPEARIRRAEVVRREALRTLELNPKHDGAYHIMGRWNAEIMRLSRVSRFVARRFLGAGVFKQASWDQAIANMEKAARLDPGRIHHHLELARIYADRKRAADAEAELHLVESLPIREAVDPILKRQGAELRRKLARR